MKALSYASLMVMTYSALFTPTPLANNTLATSSNSHQNSASELTDVIFTAEMRRTIKREIMSQPGVLLEMANMTDNGYAWTNDVVWAGSSASLAETETQAGIKTGTDLGKGVQWYIAGFMFQRARSKGVWLQYAFTLSESNGEIANFRRWYGNATFR